MVGGRVARIHKLPSSRWGRNSSPSPRTPSTANATMTAAPPSVTTRLATAKLTFVDPAQATHNQRFGLAHPLRQQQRAQGWRDGKGGDDAPGNSIGVSFSHRAEDVSLDAAQREQRDKAGDDDAGGEEDRLVHLARRSQDRPQLAGQAESLGGAGRCIFMVPFAFAQMPEDVLDHD